MKKDLEGISNDSFPWTLTIVANTNCLPYGLVSKRCISISVKGNGANHETENSDGNKDLESDEPLLPASTCLVDSCE